MGYKSEKMAENLRREISYLIRTLKNPNILNENLSVVRVEVSSDCSYARIYISSIKGISDAKRSIKPLARTVGYLRREISNRLRLKKSPSFEFIADDSVEYGARLEQIISKLN